MQHRHLHFALGLVIGLLAATAHSGETLRVEQWGQNNPHCGSEANPCRTLGFAVTVRANPRDRILVGPGHYRENIVVSNSASGLPLDGLHIRSALGPGATRIESPDGRLPVLRIQEADVVVGKTHAGFTLLPGSPNRGITAIAHDSDAS